MTRNPDPEAMVVVIVEEEIVRQDLAQFEPDPDGLGSRDAGPEAAAPAECPGADADVWIEWLDEVGESAWAAAELHAFTGL